jgi:Bacterial SH3 domain/NlpC/P60 family
MSVFVFTAGAPAPVAAKSPADNVIAVAKTKLGARWVHYAVGPRVFDCSGLVYYVFRKTGNVRKIGGRMSAYGYLAWFRHRGLASRTGAKPGDLVVWGGGSHVGIYLGHGKAISTLTSGVRIHGVHAVTAKFTAFLHTGLSVSAAKAVAAAAPATPAVAPAAPVADTTSLPSTAALPKTTTRRTTVSLNLRSRPGTNMHRIRVLRSGTRLAILRQRRDAAHRIWYKVRLSSGLTGWVAGWYTR